MWHVWVREEICTGCWWETLKEREHLEDISGKGRITGWEGVEWINLAEEDKWRGHQNMVMDLRVRSVLPPALRSLPLPTAPRLRSQRDAGDERCLPYQKSNPGLPAGVRLLAPAEFFAWFALGLRHAIRFFFIRYSMSFLKHWSQ